MIHVYPVNDIMDVLKFIKDKDIFIKVALVLLLFYAIFANKLMDIIRQLGGYEKDEGNTNK